eukprot:TRINITY_DN2_c0_g1_i3.p3 TRINITY_DN2_c0_g1~~TRINITY_DN2_c0_g1_i3.p3  ORF type:complete len:107 (-),score=4.12 TRINITY_DN2_c0_g1_i3:868-1188(-)
MKVCGLSTPFLGEEVLTVPKEQGTANFVPAAAVIRRFQRFSGITGRKASVGGSQKSVVKAQGQTLEQQQKLSSLSLVEAEGILTVAVKCVDSRRNTRGESALLGQH